MALTTAQKTKLKSALQRCRCTFVKFPTWYAEGIGTVTLGTITWNDMVNIYPRHSWVNNSASITLEGNHSIEHDRSAATGHTFTLASGSGSLIDNSDGTATYTAPSSGSGTATIKLVTTNNLQNNYAYVAYGDDEQTVAEVTEFHADRQSGGWAMTIRVMGDCNDLVRGAGILLKVDDYWNGAEDTFGGFEWSDGVFYGYVADPRICFEDMGQTYMEFTLDSPEKRLRLANLPEVIFAKSSTGEEVVDANFKVLDVLWWYFQEGFNERHNCWLFVDGNSPTNLKISEGPVWDVLEDVCKRCFCVIYASRQGDIYALPDPDVRWPDYVDSGTLGPPKSSAEIAFESSLWQSIMVTNSVIPEFGEGGPTQNDLMVGQVVLTGIQHNLDEIWARYPSNDNRPTGGKTEKISGIICDSANTLETWASRLWFKMQGVTEADLRLFMFHHLDLYEPVTLTFTPDSARVQNTGISLTAVDMFVTDLDYEIDPGRGTWRGGIHISAFPNASPGGQGENSTD